MLRWNLHAQHSIIRLKYGYYIVLGRQRYETFFIAQNFSENFLVKFSNVIGSNVITGSVVV